MTKTTVLFKTFNFFIFQKIILQGNSPGCPLQSHTKTGVIHPSLALLASGAPWWQIWAPPGGKVAVTYPDHPPKYQPNWPTDSSTINRSRLCPPGAPPGG